MVSEKDRDMRNRHPKLRLFIINSSRNSFCWEIEMGEMELFNENYHSKYLFTFNCYFIHK